MLRIFFPAGNPIDVPKSHVCFLTEKHPEQPVSLIKRVFSLFPVKMGSPKLRTDDFEMCLFNSYTQMLKQQMRFVFQTILYKTFRLKKSRSSDIKTFQEAIDKLAFGKSESSMALGQLICKFLEGDLKYWETFKMSEQHAQEAIKEGLKLWNKVNSITTILQQQQKNQELIS